jgi:hypothetical protein
VQFDRKHEFYRGSLTRPALVEALNEAHAELFVRLADLPDDLFGTSIGIFGSQVSYAQYLYGYVQHEAIHHGQWSIYAASGEYETPSLWRLQWGLGAGSA